VAEPIESSTVDVRIDAASIDTGNPDRDAHLRSADFLHADRFAVLTWTPHSPASPSPPPPSSPAATTR
jgi:polyisoprenoid-binding protein YceI